MEATTKLSSKGQMVVPKSVRDRLNWPAGAELTVEPGEDYFLVRRKEAFPRTTIDEVSGMFKIDRPIADAEIDRAIESEVRRRWRRKG